MIAYAFSSLLAFDPWHMMTSFLQYMLLSPMYINVLNIYAFANLDDVSTLSLSFVAYVHDALPDLMGYEGGHDA